MVAAAPATGARVATPSAASWGWLDARQPLTETTWVAHYLLENQRVQIDDDSLNNTLESFRRPWVAGLPDTAWFARGRFGPHAWRPWQTLRWNETACEEASDDEADGHVHALASSLSAESATGHSAWHSSFEFSRPAPFRLMDAWLSIEQAPEPHALRLQTERACPAYKTPRAVTVLRPDGEYDKFRLVDCDGSVPADALDRLSVLMRPPGIVRPELPLPDEPVSLERGEWLPGVKLVHPRLVWVLQQVTQAFPWRAIVLMSGYRRDSHGFHPKGRAIDIAVHGIENTELFGFCRSLHDVGCGFYPNNKFVHIDVRDYGSKHPAWVDIAEPGQASVYVDEWPGIQGPDDGSQRPDH